MNDVFDIKRVGKLIKVQLWTHIMPIGVVLLIMLAGCAVLNILNISITSEMVTRGAGMTVVLIVTFIAAFFTMALMTCRAFREYHVRTSASVLMTLPCSRLEQFVTLFFWYIIVLPIVMTIGVSGVELGFLSHFLSTFEGATLHDVFENVEIENIGINTFFGVWLSTASTMSLFLAGSMFFHGHEFLKTLAVSIGFLAILAILSAVLPDVVDPIKSAVSLETLKSEDPQIGSILGNIGFLAVMTGLAWIKFSRHTLE